MLTSLRDLLILPLRAWSSAFAAITGPFRMHTLIPATTIALDEDHGQTGQRTSACTLDSEPTLLGLLSFGLVSLLP